MRKLKKFVVLLLAVIFSIFSFACKPSGSAVDFTYFNTIIHVETHDFAISEQLNSSLENLFSSLEKEFDVNDENSDLYKFNHAVANEQIVVSKRFASLFNTARNFYLFTDFKFNPAIYPLIELWQFNNYPAIDFEPPNEQQISSLLGDKIDVKNIDFNLETNTISKSITEISLDFGGILKGHAVDKAFELLKNAGHKSGYISIGGSSLYVLSVNSLSIRHPRATSNMPTIISINLENRENVAISTSGDYEKYYTVNGKNYNHIISPITGHPTDTGVISATLIGASGEFGDAITTAMCLMKHEYNKSDTELISFMKRILSTYKDCSIFAVYLKDGNKEILTNKKQGEHFTLQDNEYIVTNI